MASSDWPDVELEPERNLAVAYARRDRLTPPVDIEAALAKRAVIERAPIPFDCDALFIRDGDKKRVIISTGRSVTKARERFTLAHELGHIAIPWHEGTIIACVPGSRSRSRFLNGGSWAVPRLS